MENYRLLLSLAAALLVFGAMIKLLGGPAGGPRSAQVRTLSLRETVGDIKKELQALEDTPGPSLDLVLSEVRIELLVREESSDTGTLELAVPVFASNVVDVDLERSTASSSRISVVLAPPDGTQTLSTNTQTTIKFSRLLSAIRRALHDAVDVEPRLDAKSIEVEIGFILLDGGSVGASVEAKVVTADVGSSWTRSNSNTVTLSYVNERYQQNGLIGRGDVTPP